MKTYFELKEQIEAAKLVLEGVGGTHTYGHNDDEGHDKAHDYAVKKTNGEGEDHDDYDDHFDHHVHKAMKHVDAVQSHAKKKGYGKKDITFHTDGNDSSPSAYTVHKGGAAEHDKKVNPGKNHAHHLFHGSPA